MSDDLIYLDTGTGPTRRRLTEAEAASIPGPLPTPLTRAEWDAMHEATRDYPGPAQWRTVLARLLMRGGA